MKFIKDRNVFKKDIILENLNLSNDLISILSKIDNPVSKLLIYASKNDIEDKPYRQDNLSLSDKRSYFTFDKGKNNVKVGRLVNKIVKKLRKDISEEEFQKRFGEIKEKDVQKFVDQYNEVILNKKESKDEFRLLKGDDIYKSYQYCGSRSNSSLGHSCMIGESEHIFQLYTKNPNSVGIATLWEDNDMFSEDKLLGRALIWKTKEQGYVMDRIYSNSQEIEDKFKSWASDQNFPYRHKQDYRESNADRFIKNGEEEIYELSVKLDNLDFDEFPYMDTFKFIEDDNNLLSNVQTPDSTKKLDETDGTYEDLVPEREIEKLFEYDNLLRLSDVQKNVYKSSDRKGEKIFKDLNEDHLVLCKDDWTCFIDLFLHNQYYKVIKEILDFGLFNEVLLPDSIIGYWDDIKDTTKEIIFDICKEVDNDIFIFKASNEKEMVEKLKKYPNLNKRDLYPSIDIIFNDYNIKKRKGRDVYFTIKDDKIKTLVDEIEENDDFYDLKLEILKGIGDAQRLADEQKAFNTVVKSISNYISGSDKYKSYYNVYIPIDIDKIKIMFLDLETVDIRDFSDTYLISFGSLELVEMLSHSIYYYYNFPDPDFKIPNGGFYGDPSEIIDESILNNIDLL